ncbi:MULTISPECIES: type II toxin-antitoxin system PemK/MazF family toxin [unclassified Microcoleus]|uniref:type II toxin-antitoxin system PemK/MazF family toxin n=1 Tax=unclassified Microcoleus TaxID=2642155 RepID=UPI002FD04146
MRKNPYMNSPERGEIWLVDLGYTAKVRPCLVVSIPALNQDRALATLGMRIK